MFGEKRNHEEDIKKLKEHIINNGRLVTASKYIGCSDQYVYELIRECIEKGVWFTEEEQRELGLIGENKSKRSKVQPIGVPTDEIEKLKYYFYIYGNDWKAIERESPYPMRHLKKLKEIAIKNGLWFSEEEEKEVLDKVREQEIAKQVAEQTRQDNVQAMLDEQRKQRKEDSEKAIEAYNRMLEVERSAQEAEKGISQEQTDVAVNEKVVQKQDDIAVDEEVKQEQTENTKQKKNNVKQRCSLPRQRKARSYLYEEYKRCKKSAKSEDRQEINGKERVSTEGRKALVKIMQRLQALEILIPDDDIEIIINGYDMHTEIVNKDGIQVLIYDASQKGGIPGTKKRVNELLSSLRKTKYYQPLLQYKKWLNLFEMRTTIKEMQNDGLSIADIATHLRLSLAEINQILNLNEMPKFSGPDDMDM